MTRRIGKAQASGWVLGHVSFAHMQYAGDCIRSSEDYATLKIEKLIQ
jgi:hypothetical protein